jgi:endonuclease YncB( thermonuclease family)
MFLRPRLLLPPLQIPGAALAAATFVAGLALGTGMNSASLLHRPPPQPLSAPPAARSAPADMPAGRMAHPAEVLRVLDGDTFEARVQLWPGLEITTRVRLRGIDAPELKARCGEERDKAEAARDALRALLDQGDVGISHVGLDKYGGRVLAKASTRTTPDVSAALLDAGWARGYAGGRRETWCR